MQKVAILQHAEGEWIGSMQGWFADKAFELQTYRLDFNEALPTIDTFDWLLIMGGPMSVNDEDTYPWLPAEKKLIKEAIEAGKKVMGIERSTFIFHNGKLVKEYRKVKAAGHAEQVLEDLKALQA